MMYLIKYKDDYADEFDVEGFVVWTEEHWQNYRERLSKVKDSFEIYFGTNEYMEYCDGLDLLSNYQAYPLIDEEPFKLITLFPKCETTGYGHFIQYEADLEEDVYIEHDRTDETYGMDA